MVLTMIDKTGQTISHYKILELLGRGGMSMVYKARDVRLDRCVALKFLSPELSADEEIKRRFIREAQTASALEHQHICTIFEIDETPDGQIFIAMAYCEGGSLKDKIAGGRLSWEEAVDLAMQAAQGLAKAHERGIIHRDVKPANVMLTDDGVAKIVDFGLAKLTHATRLTRTGEIMGTPAYMSPEQARFFDVDHRSDIWSLGVVLYEMLAQQLPFHGENTTAMLYAIVHEKPEPLRKHAPDVPGKLAEAIERALVKSPDLRYQSVNDMLLSLRALGSSQPSGLQVPVPELQTEPLRPLSRPETRDRAIVLVEDSFELTPAPEMTLSEKLRLLPRLTPGVEEQLPASPPGNPFLNRLMIQHPQYFYGRHAELMRIYERIKAVRPQSMSIVGVRRIGKSSLLKAIHHPENRRRYLPHPEEYVFVFMDLQAKRNVVLPEIFRYIYSELQKEYRGRLRVNASPDYDGMQEIVSAFQEAGLKLIFLWDEFESVTRNHEVGPEFYAFFRALANNFNVAYITSSADQLQRLCHAKEISDSPFFNIFTNQRLGVFKNEEARQLILELSAKAGRSLAPYVDFVLDIAGCFPFFIQIACSALYALAAEGKPDLGKAKEAFMEEAGPHFLEYWERFDESKQAVVVALARKKSLPREHAFALKDLTQEGFVSEGKLFSSLFTEFVRESASGEPPWWKLW